MGYLVSVISIDQKMIKKLSTIIILGVVLFSTYSCTDDYFDFDKFKIDPLKPEIAIPLINSSLTPRDIFLAKETPDIITTNNDGLLTIVYETGGYRINTADLFTLQDQSYNESVALTATEIAALPIQGTISRTYTTSYNFDNPSGVRLDSMLTKSGLLKINLNSDLQHGGLIKVSFPTFVNNGSPLSFELPLDYNGSTPVLGNSTTNLDNYTISIDNSTGNQIPVTYEITINYSGNSISPQDSIRLSIESENLQFKSFFGYAGQQTISFPEDSLPLALFQGAIGGSFYVAEPKLSINTVNGFGIPIDVQFNKFDANTVNSGTFPIQLPQNPVSLNAPTTPGDSARTSIVLDANNSNIDNVVSALPKEFIFDFTALLNPGGDLGQNFVIDNIGSSVSLQFELPLVGTVSNYVLIDTLDFDFDNTQLLDAAIFRTNIKNGFPVDADLQIYFADANARILDSLFIGQKKIITSGTIDANGKVIQSTNEIVDTEVDKIGLTNLFRSSKVIIKANLSTTNNGATVVRFYDDYRLDVKLGMKAKFNLDFD